MTITLTPEHESIIRAQIATGQFRSVNEVLDRGLAPPKPQRPDASEDGKRAKTQAAAELIRELRAGITLDRPKGMSLREYARIGQKH